LGLCHGRAQCLRRQGGGLCLGAARAVAPQGRGDERAVRENAARRACRIMSINLLVAPDFSFEHFSGWHLLNTVLQRKTALAMRLWTPASSAEQAQCLAEGKADIVYANPFDAS